MSQNLSWFHHELLNYLLRDVSQKTIEGGFDEVADIELQSFRNDLAQQISAGAPLALDELVDAYNYLFNKRGSLHLEKKLIMDLSSESLIRVYRGLPRQYRKNEPLISQVKKHFTHLPTLKALAAEKILFEAYDGMEYPGMGKVTIFTYVLPDGWGDVIASIETVEILKRRFPSLQICWVVLLPHKMGAPPLPKGANEKHLIYYEKCESLFITEEAARAMRLSDFILQIPTFYPFFESLQQQVNAIDLPSPPPSWSSFGEYGFIESDWHHPESANRSLGLHFLEKGVFVKEPLQAKSFLDLQNKQLLNWLFGKDSPSLSEMEMYRKSHHFYLAYLSSPVGGSVYLQALQKMHEHDLTPIDVCCPDIRWLIEEGQKNLVASPILDSVSIELYLGEHVAILKEGRKKIRLFCPQWISVEDFQLLIQMSGDFVAVRGNQSFSEAISQEKPFFFDARPHSLNFLKDLLALAENRIHSNQSTLNVLRGTAKIFLHNAFMQHREEWVDDSYFQEEIPSQQIALNIGEALQHKDCLDGFKKLHKVIKEEHSFNQFLCYFVQRELCQRAYPFVKGVETAIVASFTSGAFSLKRAAGELKKQLAYGR